MVHLGIDIGGTKLALAVSGPEGRLLAHFRRPIDPCGSWERDLDRIVEDGWRLLEEATGAGAGPLVRVGISAPGPLDVNSGMLLAPPNLPGWLDVPIVDRIGEAFGVPTRLDNDANAAALAERRFGAGRGTRNLVYLTMSTGIGAGLILDGRLHRGPSGGAGEVGHLPVEAGGLLCACGLRGCLEAYVGGRAWRGHLQRETPAGSRVMALAGDDREAIRPEHLVAAAREGDAFACRELDRWLGYLKRGIVALVMTLEPERIVLGTIAVAAGESLCFAPLRRALTASLWPHQAQRLEVVPAALGSELPLRAGLAVAAEADGEGLPPGA